MSKPTLADDCERMVRILEGAPEEGLSLFRIQEVTESEGDRWPLRTINSVLLSLGSAVSHQKIRVRYGKETVYRLRSK